MTEDAARGRVAVAAVAMNKPFPLLVRLASLRLTLVILVVFLAGVLTVYRWGAPATLALVIPLVAFAVNLGAAVATHPTFRRQTPLLVFHLALIALVLLVAAGRLTYLKGQAELTTGVEFDGRLTQVEAGPWHAGALESVRFTSQGFEIDYAPGMKRGATRDRVTWRDADGVPREGVVGDQQPLSIAGYRFYTTPNKGYAPLFLWRPEVGEPALGAVHLPSYPAHDYRQSRTWPLPGDGRAVYTQLRFDETIGDPARPWSFRMPKAHRVLVRLEGRESLLEPGQSMRLADGVLVYQGLTTWMGFHVDYDWTLPWLLAAGVLAVLSLGMHFWRKFAGRPWNA